MRTVVFNDNGNRYSGYEYEQANRILRHVADKYRQDVTAFNITARPRNLSFMRFTTAKMLREHIPSISLQQIATLLGRKNHTTVIKALQKVDDFVKNEDPLFFPTYNDCITSFKPHKKHAGDTATTN